MMPSPSPMKQTSENAPSPRVSPQKVEYINTYVNQNADVVSEQQFSQD
jgi:hypothetical protein